MGSIRTVWWALALTSMLGCSQGSEGIISDEGDASVDASFVEEPANGASPEGRAVVAKLTQSLDALRANAPPLDLPLASSSSLVADEPVSVRLVREGVWLKAEPTTIDPAKTAELRLPLDAREAFRIADPQTGISALVSLRGASESEAEVVSDHVVYRQAAPGLGDVVHRPSASGTEDFILYEQKPADEKLAYEVVLDERVRGLRLVANTLELLDEGGAPRLRVAPPYVIGNDGQRYDAELSVKGCAVDINPAAPWGREPVAPGASECTVEVAWGDRDVRYPAVVDPSWMTTRTMISSRYSHVAELLPTGKVLVAGGYGGVSLTYLAAAELYDPATDTWTPTTSLTYPRYEHTGTLLPSGKVLVAGGYGNNGVHGSGEIYDPQSGTWSLTNGPMVSPRYRHTAALLQDGTVLITAGTGSSSYLSGSELYSPATDSFSSTGSLKTGRYHPTSVTLADGRVLVAGGNGGSYLNSAEIYDPVTKEFTYTPSFSGGRELHSMTLLASGKVLVFGGSSSSSSPVLYDPESNSWATLSSAYTQYHHSATLLPDGNVLIAGGYSSGYLNRALLYHPDTNVFVLTTSMPSTRAYQKATALPSGDVLLTGGYNGGYLATTVRFRMPMPCSDDADCASGYCVAGQCCETACDDGCGRCNLAGFEGLCRAAPSGAVGDPSCSPYVCNGSSTSCPSSCTSNSQCAADRVCVGNQCVTKLAQGAACTAAAQCQSGFCSDGRCCNTACSGACDVCAISLGASSDGTCTFLPSTSTCATNYLCSGVSGSCPTSCASDANCASNAYCNANKLCVAKLANGGACSSANQCQSGNCIDGYCCNNSCEGSCNRCDVSASRGICTVVASGNVGAPACSPYLCNGASADCPSSCSNDAQCASGNFCDGGKCIAKRAVGETCNGASQCQSGFCVDGYCCDKACAGGCEACAQSLGASSNGTCTILPSTQTCGNYVCNGTSGTCPTSCSSDASCASGRYCNSTFLGSCVLKLNLGASCTANNQCSSGSCVDGVCCNNDCAGGCNRCNLSGSVGTCTNVPAGTSGQNPSCGAFICNGASASCPTSCTNDSHCVTTAKCNGGVCVGKVGQGQSCSENRDCLSGFCADGVCCNTACGGGGCDRCDLAGFVGTCRTVSAGQQGSPTCAPYVCTGASTSCPTSCTSESQCMVGFACVAGSCEPKKSNGTACAVASECASGHCTDGVCCDSLCNGLCSRCDLAGSKGTCSPAAEGTPASSCGAYLCNGIELGCPTSCQDDADCDGHCYAGKCYGKQPLGSACSSHAACESGFCVDGSCCDSACDGQCARCDAPGSVGTCSPVKGAPVGDRPACTSDGSVCAGTCDGVNVETCTYPSAGAACGPWSCEEGAVTERACDGQGLCEVKSESCAPYACGDSECLTGCASDADCSGSAECVGGECKGTLEGGASCSNAGECASGFCVDGVCCQSSCTDDCKACNLPGSAGVCTPDPTEAGCEGAGVEAPLWDGQAEESGCGCRVAGEKREGRAQVLGGLAIVVAWAFRRRKAGKSVAG